MEETTWVSVVINGIPQDVEVEVTMDASLIAKDIVDVTEHDPFISLATNEWLESRDDDVPIYSYVSDDGKLSIEFDAGTYVDIEVDLSKTTTVWLFSSSYDGRLKVEGWGGLFNTFIDETGIILKESFLYNQQNLPSGVRMHNTTLIRLD